MTLPPHPPPPLLSKMNMLVVAGIVLATCFASAAAKECNAGSGKPSDYKEDCEKCLGTNDYDTREPCSFSYTLSGTAKCQ